MVRSFVFTIQGRVHSRDIEPFLMPTLLADTNLFLWVDLQAPTALESRQILEDLFHFHPLSIEDCLQPNPLPKVEEYHPKEGDKFSLYLFTVIHAVDFGRERGRFATRELNFFLGKNFFVTFHDVPIDSLRLLEEHCLRGAAPLPRAPDRLAHLVLDFIVDHYKPALEAFSLQIGLMEESIVQHPVPAVLNQILQVKKEVLRLRQIIGPQREVLARFARGEFRLIRPHLAPYFRDVDDALFHISALAQTYADSLTGLLQVYLNLSSNQTGEVVKLLTMLTFITTPLVLIGTWYGMNFQGMPELKWRYGYLTATLVTLVSTAATFWYFKRRKWL